jgi:hypothetical protein
MKQRFLLFLMVSAFSWSAASAQIREIPKAVKDSFAVQFPDAGTPNYIDNIVNVQVKFEHNGETKLATFTNKGQWKETEQPYDFEKLNADVKDGFEKSRYSGTDWKVADTKLVTRPAGVELYRVKVEKNDVQKKYLYFNTSGKLVHESITL